MKKLWLLLSITLLFSHPSFGDWFFRGTPNGWNTTSMEQVSGNQYRTCQTFNGEDHNARFKIDRFGDWSENYPPQDIVVADFQTYQIEFNSQTKAITHTQVNQCDGNVARDTWYFRGTTNGWGKTELIPIEDTDQQEILVTFNGEDHNARFKIDSGNWTESYPGQDLVVADFKTYRIVFDEGDKSVTATEVVEPVTLTSISISPSSIQLNPGDNQALAVHAHYSDNSTRTVTDDTSFTSSHEAIASVSNTGLVSAQTIGTTIITASYEGESTSASVTVNNDVAPVDFREETIYFVLTARFYDGDSSNNYFNRDRLNPDDPQWRGDFKGLIEQLDYIKDLGFTAIWVTPPVENRSGLDYHGYHAYDWYQVDPRLESVDATYQDFITAAHNKGLKVVQDVVINHSSQYGIRNEVWIDHLPIKYYRPDGCVAIDNGPYQGNLGDYLSANRDDNDNPVAPQWFRDRHQSDPEGDDPLVDPKTGETVPSCGYDSGRFFGIDANNLNEDWYHQEGFMAGGDWENPQSLFKKHLAGDAIDLYTSKQHVKDYMNTAIQQYLDMGVDAIRLDTAKHVERDELLSYVHNWQNHKPGLFVFGEVLVKGMGFGSENGNDNGPAEIRPWWYTRTTDQATQPSGDSNLSVLDFPLFSTFRDNVTKGSFSQLGSVINNDWFYTDPTELVTFFQNHDVGPDNDFKYRFGGEEAHAALAYNVLWTIRGIPTLYYGEEIMFQAGKHQDIEGNDMLVSDTGRAYFGNHLTGTELANTQNHNLYKHIQRLNQIRHGVPALQKGTMSHVNEWGSGMSFVRQFENSYAVVGLADGGGQTFSVSGVLNGTYRDAVTGSVQTVNNGTLNFGVAGNSIGVYVLDGSGKIGQDGPYLK